MQTASRTALRSLIDTLTEIDERWSGPEWNLHSEEDVAVSHRALMHILEASMVGFFEQDAARPDLRRITTPSRKLTGDNPDAVYFDAPLSAQYRYVLHGSMHGASYFSLTIEEGTAEGHMASNSAGVINDTEMLVADDGSFTLYIGGEPRARNWLSLTPDASRLTTRHYFEHEQPAALDPAMEPRMRIECLDVQPPASPPTDISVASNITRVTNVIRSRTLEMPPLANSEPPPFVALTPNEFPAPIKPGDFGFAATDAHYSMAPFFLGPDEALIIRGRWPTCRFANLCLWNRFQQTLDYRSREVSINRAQTVTEKDGSFRLVVAHQNPGVANWLDTEGQPFGLMFWRFFLAEGEVVTPTCEVVKLSEVDSTV